MIRLLEDRGPKGIWAGDMKDGDVGIIVAWSMSDDYLEEIVQRFDKMLITIGKPSDYVWDEIDRLNKNCRVRLLEKGEKLVVT